MKNIIYMLIVFTICVSASSAQMREKGMFMPPGAKPMEKLEQLEKMKLIEILDLDEETSIRFFARKNEHQKKMKDLIGEREKTLAELENAFRDKKEDEQFYKRYIAQVLEFENKIINERNNFITSLNTILTQQQIAKLTVFEFKFRRELTEQILERGRGMMKRDL